MAVPMTPIGVACNTAGLEKPAGDKCAIGGLEWYCAGRTPCGAAAVVMYVTDEAEGWAPDNSPNFTAATGEAIGIAAAPSDSQVGCVRGSSVGAAPKTAGEVCGGAGGCDATAYWTT
mmetsp:Transcript_258/g.861  ORF Transcript_258/g.861 Transcript_258/m.861 type:complete len:117 (+) Transcript_258:443-793(+)